MQIDFADLKAKVGIAKVCEMLKLEMKPEKNHLRGKCPLCPSSNPRSFVVTPDKNLWFCHSCNAGGVQLKLVALVRNTDIRNAAVSIAESFGTVTVPTANRSNTAPS